MYEQVNECYVLRNGVYKRLPLTEQDDEPHLYSITRETLATMRFRNKRGDNFMCPKAQFNVCFKEVIA